MVYPVGVTEHLTNFFSSNIINNILKIYQTHTKFGVREFAFICCLCIPNFKVIKLVFLVLQQILKIVQKESIIVHVFYCARNYTNASLEKVYKQVYENFQY